MPRDISSSSSGEDEEPGPETHADLEPTVSRRTRFQCPEDFVSFSYKACSSTMKTSSSSELWLIKAPASFDPQSFSGVQLPLSGLQTLRVPSGEGEEHTYSVLGSSHRSPEFRLLTSPKNAASLASPFAGLMSLSQSYSDHGTHPALHVVPAVPPPSLMPGLRQRFQHTAFKSAAPSPAQGEERRKRRREKKIKMEPEEAEEACEPDELRSCIKIKTETEVKAEEQRRKKKKKSKSDD
ncbi:DNA-directed RNA polymerase I subunit RPA34 [Eucyclogobius newberryi]|uniref:DNA-directed RNA polymerase I subunit RPA34 n=1 Tax=Eucyclogobius newberryi TaxID=166745 RepID=UPI003B5A1A7C